jgi:hypothetical protein
VLKEKETKYAHSKQDNFKMIVERTLSDLLSLVKSIYSNQYGVSLDAVIDNHIWILKKAASETLTIHENG